MARNTIDRDSAVPMWRQLADILRSRIRTGDYPAGRVLPSEIEMEGEFGIARGTVRKAVALLRDEGLVRTSPGKGTYVADDPPGNDDM